MNRPIRIKIISSISNVGNSLGTCPISKYEVFKLFFSNHIIFDITTITWSEIVIGDRNVFFLNSKFSDLWRNVCVGGAAIRKTKIRKRKSGTFWFCGSSFRFKVDTTRNDSKLAIFYSENTQKYNNKQINILNTIEKWLLNWIFT